MERESAVEGRMVGGRREAGERVKRNGRLGVVDLEQIETIQFVTSKLDSCV